ncbi:putative efflux pump antibiotic resistance protein [Byssothecium circinans]|uniref:Putative efflux pump antibiotic resistance protein n=1 Tax=Byssothecium circinans TaxID=147558 RepID=A0A6A5TH45_9PLEO|nr:putative efflux pump antibiotic resistance protein [Byssothecium circinans]
MDASSEKKSLSQRPSESAELGNTSDVTVKDAEEGQYPVGLKFAILASAALVAVFLIALDQTIIGTAIPKITDEFHGLEDVSWYAAAYFMTFGAAHASAGKLYKYCNLKWSFLGSMLVFEVGSLICGVAPNSKSLVVGRAIAGLGAAGLSVGSTSIIALSTPPPKRPMMMGLVGATYAISAVMGPLIGGAFTETTTWRWCFYINLPIGGVSALALFFFLNLSAFAAPPDIPWTQKLLHLDPVGISLAMGAITCFILGLQYAGSTHPWDSSIVIGLIVGFVLITAVLVAWEIWLGEYSMMLPRLWKHRWLYATASYQFFFMGSYIVLLYYLPIYFQSILGAGPIRSGVDNLPLVLAASVFALVGGAVVMKTGRAQQVMLVSSGLTTVAIGLIYTLDVGSSTGKWAGYQLFVGIVLAFGIMHGLSIVQANVDAEDISAVTANLLFFQTVGGAFSTSSGQAAFINQLLAELPKLAPTVNPGLVIITGATELHNVFPPDVLPGVLQAYMNGIKAAFAVGVGFAGTAFISSIFIPWKKLPTHVEGEPMVMVV